MALNDDEDDAMLDGFTFGHSTFYRGDAASLSYRETEKLMKSLNKATNIIQGHFEELRKQEAQRQERWIKRPKRFPRLRACMLKTLYQLNGAKGITLTIALQLVNLVMLTLVDSLPKSELEKDKALQWGMVIMLVLQIINLVIVLAISVQLARQLSKRNISGILLIQSYFATSLVFAGIYTATYRLNPKAWKFIMEDIDKDPIMIVVLYCRFLFFSVSTATLCGSADALPKEWHTCMFASAQMLVSFLYFTSVIGHALAPLAGSASDDDSVLPRYRTAPPKHRPTSAEATADRNASINR